MPRPAAGPVRIDSTGTWYARKQINGKRHVISLRTKVKSEAHKRWPAAQAELERMTQVVPGDPDAPHLYLDPDTGKEYWGPSPWDKECVTTDQDERITWVDAEDIAAKRYQRKKGKEVSRSWHYNVKNALTQLALSQRKDKGRDPSSFVYPLDLTTKDVRRLVDSMEERGLAATTIAQRCSVLSGLIDALIKGGYTDDDYTNPFSRVDTAAISTNHHHTAQPDQYALMWERAKELKPEFRQMLWVLMHTGCRISEVHKARYEGTGTSRVGWVLIEDRDDYSPKNKSSVREVPFPPSPVEAGIDGAMTADTFRRWFNKIRPNTKLVLHNFRHGYKSAAREAGADWYQATRLMGHTASRMDTVYGEDRRTPLVNEASKIWGVIEKWMKNEDVNIPAWITGSLFNCNVFH